MNIRSSFTCLVESNLGNPSGCQLYSDTSPYKVSEYSLITGYIPHHHTYFFH